MLSISGHPVSCYGELGGITGAEAACAQVGMVVICGKVTSVERAATKTTYTMEDNSGSLEVSNNAISTMIIMMTSHANT